MMGIKKDDRTAFSTKFSWAVWNCFMSRGRAMRLSSTSAWFPDNVESAGIRENC